MTWQKLKQQLESRGESKEEIALCKAFHMAGWVVYPESGHRFQRNFKYDDGSEHRDGLSKSDAMSLAESILSEMRL